MNGPDRRAERRPREARNRFTVTHAKSRGRLNTRARRSSNRIALHLLKSDLEHSEHMKKFVKSNRKAIARVLNEQLACIKAGCTRAAKDHSPEPLHDIRIGLRRFAQLLRLFRKPLSDTNAEAVRARIRTMTQRIGTLRDSDVWITHLNELTEGTGIREHKRWAPYFKAESRRHIAARRKFPQLLAGHSYQSLIRSMTDLIRTGIRGSVKTGSYGPADNLAGRRTAKLVRKIVAEGMPGIHTRPAELHAFRRLCRRARYWADAAGTLGNSAGRMAGALKSLATELGTIHDIDVAKQRLKRAYPPPPPELARHLGELRNDNWRRVEAAWRRFERQARRLDQ